MCLYNAENVKTAEADIECYKLLWEVARWKYLPFLKARKLISPFYKMRYEIGKTYESKIVHYVGKSFAEDYSVVTNGLHSFANKDDAASFMKRYTIMGDVLVRCVIPKGSEYSTGTFIGTLSYASNKITAVEIIKGK